MQLIHLRHTIQNLLEQDSQPQHYGCLRPAHATIGNCPGHCGMLSCYPLHGGSIPQPVMPIQNVPICCQTSPHGLRTTAPTGGVRHLFSAFVFSIRANLRQKCLQIICFFIQIEKRLMESHGEKCISLHLKLPTLLGKLVQYNMLLWRSSLRSSHTEAAF